MTSLDSDISLTIKGGESDNEACGLSGSQVGPTIMITCGCPPVSDSILHPACAGNSNNTDETAEATCPGAGG